jgi:hypothetical protein
MIVKALFHTPVFSNSGPAFSVTLATKTCRGFTSIGTGSLFRNRFIFSAATGVTNLLPVPVAVALQGGVTGTAYSETISVQGGSGPYTFSVSSGALPSGLSLNTSSGVISGTPLATATYTFAIQVTDVNANVGTQSFTIITTAPGGGGGGGGSSLTFIG